MFDILFQRTTTERQDQERTVRSMSYNVPGHKDRLEAHRKRVQEDYFDSGLHYAEMHSAQGGGVVEWETKDKRCYTCKEVKPIDDFFRDKDQKDGYRANCKPCHKDILNSWTGACKCLNSQTQSC